MLVVEDREDARHIGHGEERTPGERRKGPRSRLRVDDERTPEDAVDDAPEVLAGSAPLGAR